MIKGTPRPRTGQARSFDAWALVGTALVTIILVLVNYISSRRYERWDLTRDRLFTLSERTEQVLKQLDKPVTVYLFMSAGEPNYAEMRELIARYRAKSEKLTAEFIDPDREPTRFQTLAEKYGVRGVGLADGSTESELAALVTSGDKHWRITRDDLVDFDYDSFGGNSGPKINVKTEQALTGALLQVTSGRATKVCVTEGHGEWALEATERSLAPMRDELRRENIEVEALATRGKNELPKSCDAIFVIGPRKAFTSEESEALKRYLDAGGNLLIALDPVISGEQILETGLEALGEALGVRVEGNIVVELDETRLLTPSPVEQFLVTNFSDHPTMRPLNGLGAPVVMLLARGFRLSEGSDAEALLKSSDKAYAEAQLAELAAGDDLKPSEGDLKGPVVIAAAVDTRPEEPGQSEVKLGGRAVFIGDSEWLTGELLQQPQLANVDLLASITGYLTERKELVSIAPRKINAQAVVITEDGLMGVFFRTVVLMPLAAFIFGLGIWWQRRS